MTSRKINILAKPFDILDGETCYCCGLRAVVAIRGDANEPGTGFCLCERCFSGFKRKISCMNPYRSVPYRTPYESGTARPKYNTISQDELKAIYWGIDNMLDDLDSL